MKQKLLNILCGVFIVLIIAIVVFSRTYGFNSSNKDYDDGIKQLDINTIYLKSSGVEVNFSDILLSKQEETRKLIVSKQTGTVTTNLTDRLINQLDFDFLKKTQQISYTGTGFFVVDLDNISKNDIINDSKNKKLTIKIDHAHLQTIEIKPEDIIIDSVKEGLLARGNIKLSIADYNVIEQDIRKRLEEKFNTAANGQTADDNALKMVKDVYEPIVKAVDNRYIVEVVFK